MEFDPNIKLNSSYLEHYGKKGMRWGQTRGSKIRSGRKSGLSKSQLGVGRTVGLGSLIVAGKISGKLLKGSGFKTLAVAGAATTGAAILGSRITKSYFQSKNEPLSNIPKRSTRVDMPTRTSKERRASRKQGLSIGQITKSGFVGAGSYFVGRALGRKILGGKTSNPLAIMGVGALAGTTAIIIGSRAAKKHSQNTNDYYQN